MIIEVIGKVDNSKTVISHHGRDASGKEKENEGRGRGRERGYVYARAYVCTHTHAWRASRVQELFSTMQRTAVPTAKPRSILADI